MIDSLFKKTSLLAGLLVVCIESLADATATATVTVNVVPGSSFFVSDSIELNEKHGQLTIKESKNRDQATVVLSSLYTRKPVVFKVIPYDDRIYNISISSSSILANSSGSIKLGNMKIAGESGLSGEGEEKVLVIEGEITRTNEVQNDPFIGITEINLNYN